MDCFTNITDTVLTDSDNCENASGIAERAYFYPKSSFKKVAVPVPSTTAASLVTITTAHELEVGAKPIIMYPLFQKSGAASTTEGEITSLVDHGTLEFFIPSMSVGNIGTAMIMKNMRGLAFFKEIGGKHLWQFGNEEIWAIVTKIDKNFGTGPTGEKGIKVTIEVYGQSAFWKYDSEIPVPVTP